MLQKIKEINSNMIGNKKINEIIEFLKSLKYKRYKLCILIVKANKFKREKIKELTKKINGKYYNFLFNINTEINDSLFGVYNPSDFIEWLENRTIDDNKILVIDDIEPIITTFPHGEQDVIKLFNFVGNLEIRGIIILVTIFNSLVKKSNFPKERILYF